MLPFLLSTADKFPFSSLLTDNSESDEFFGKFSTSEDLFFPSDISFDSHLFIILLGLSAYWEKYIGDWRAERQYLKQHY